ncbi:MAG: sulfite exporter TauE/SafE family protein [Clostridiales bacterium]|nr:sulfite exporter TauE/SafE family protein [Clostridiales bacterium]
MLNHILFYLTIFLSNIIQGITGFAGTLLAMPFSLRLVGADIAVPVLNFLGFVSGLYVFLPNRDKVVWGEIKKVVTIMIPFMFLGVLIRERLMEQQRILYLILGVLVIFMAIRGLRDSFLKRDEKDKKPLSDPVMNLILILSGIIHGMFVSGGSLLVIYMAERLDDKTAFRSTLSAVWVILNGILLVTQIFSGDITGEVAMNELIALPVLFLAMYIGSVLFKRMEQRTFLIITYILLIISGISLFIK